MTGNDRRYRAAETVSTDNESDSCAVVVFADGGAWWLINRGGQRVTRVRTFLRIESMSIEVDELSTASLEPNAQLRCEPRRSLMGESVVTVEVSWIAHDVLSNGRYVVTTHGWRSENRPS